ncbi:MAG: phosphoribosylformylglycinamidine synthase subunit PurQ [Deltaproteobacteria bacterium]|nr:phosphoribosylformylglycinamidine synthase subunit PurQ [Deltaproteobacteria bacterium]
MKCAIIQFPGSNCDQDCMRAVRDSGDMAAEFVWHKAEKLPPVDAVIIPGGFSYGDYLRAGAIAAHAPVMRAVQSFAALGGLVLGICNGFQILTEAGLLPGVLLMNRTLQFACRPVRLRVERTDGPFTAAYAVGANATPPLTMPIAHGQGSYFVDPATLRTLQERRQIVFRYCDAHGAVTTDANPNGSIDGIAGVCNAAGNVLGLMPHPERAADSLLGGVDGLGVFRSMLAARRT